MKKKNISYKWVVAVVSFLMIFVTLGFCSSNKSLYLSAITKAMHIERSLFSINDSCRYIVTAVVNLFFGSLVARFGAKKMVGAGFLALIASTLIYAHAQSILVFYIGGCLLGLGLSWTGTTMASYMVNRWFTNHRGTVMGFVLCANGLGGALAAQLVTPIIYNEADAFGYRTAYKLVAVLLLVVGMLVIALIREPDQASAGEASRKKAVAAKGCVSTMSEALRRPYFYTTALCILITGMSLQGIGGISAAHMSDVGLDPGYIALAVSAHSLVLTASKFLAGVSYDKLGLRPTLVICEFCGAVAFFCLALADASRPGLAMVYSILSSLALPLETVIVPLIAADLFGEKIYTKMLGIFVSINTAGFALGSPVANLVYDTTGSYRPILIVFALCMLAMIAAFQLIFHAVEKERIQSAAQTDS